MEYSTFGRHILVDLWEVDAVFLDDQPFLQKHLITAANICGATVLSVDARTFQPSGTTILILLSESHISIHTYPEKGFAAIDCYTCGTKADPQKAIDYVISILKPKQLYTKRFTRGLGDITVIE
ncbi:adenosylmethionine decarboxylase [Bacillus sp. BP-3]|uniref:adenosylmethionine decarboxylase n=1 Tax=Bacillus sp. BP-3 TaxID=3022773 RepID=UPI00232CD823|nr:adenosylmethionine decarboxylase [Bacillus sp. BP-3]MDC2866148.1 adenosylmethionine decarboxylase [Bacillus sp. BP-3]